MGWHDDAVTDLFIAHERDRYLLYFDLLTGQLSTMQRDHRMRVLL